MCIALRSEPGGCKRKEANDRWIPTATAGDGHQEDASRCVRIAGAIHPAWHAPRISDRTARVDGQVPFHVNGQTSIPR